MSDSNNYFEEQSKYNELNNFTQIKFGHDKPLFEVELNELQQIQQGFINSLSKKMLPNGIIYNSLNKNNILYNNLKGENGTWKYNHIAIAPSQAIIDGHQLTLAGNFTPNDWDSDVDANYILLDLGDAPKEGCRDDLVYLEVWFQQVNGFNDLYKWGYVNGEKLYEDEINNPIIDYRVNKESSQRVALFWDIKTVKNVSFNKFNEVNLNKNVIYATGNINSQIEQFRHANNAIYSECSFYNSNNLWIAGKPDQKFGDLGYDIYGKYIYGMPLFKVHRRNKKVYSINNYNGSRKYNNTSLQNPYGLEVSSSQNGDINLIRPDKGVYNLINDKDIVDLRHSIGLSNVQNEYLLNSGIKQLFTGKLLTKQKNDMKRIQIGNFPIAEDDLYYDDIIFYNTFNNTLNPIKYSDNNSEPIIDSDTEYKYSSSAINSGLLLTGNYDVRYNLSNSFNKSEGTIDFSIQPKWNGFEDNVNQTIFKITNNSNYEDIIILKKEGSNLIIQNKIDNSNTINEIIDLKEECLLKNNIYNIRLSWKDGMYLYINGKNKATMSYSPSTYETNRLVIGSENDDISNGFVIENFIIYNSSFEEEIDGEQPINRYWPMLFDNKSNDIIHEKASILPSFNGKFRAFKNNNHIQNGIISVVNPSNGEIEIKAPENSFISDIIQEPIVYNASNVYYNNNERQNDDPKKDIIISGTWSNLNTKIATFTPDNTIDDNEEFIVQYDIFVYDNICNFNFTNKLLSAGFIKRGNYEYSSIERDYNFDEVSFAHEKSTIDNPRTIQYANPLDGYDNQKDISYDYSIKNRPYYMSGARYLHYYMNGNNTDRYYIEKERYGREVIGIEDYEIINQTEENKIRDIYIVENFTDDKKENFTGYIVEFERTILRDDHQIMFVLALDGVAFDYNNHNKEIVSNIHKVKYIEFVTNGQETEYTLSNYDNNGGIIKSVLTHKINEERKNVYYSNHQGYGDYSGSFKSIHSGKINSYELVSGLDTPFITIKLDELLEAGTIIKIPVLVSYQPESDEVLSIWYDHNSYQGILTRNERKIKRITDWKFFITTLGSGNINPNIDFDSDNDNSIVNIIDRLPGGYSNSSFMNGDKIELENLSSTINNNNVNSQIIFINDVTLGSIDKLDNYLGTIETEYVIKKDANNYQDSKIIIDNEFIAYLPECNNNFNKYIGAACLVIDNNGEILLFVVGNVDIDSTKKCKLKIEYGDLFRLNGLPKIKN